MSEAREVAPPSDPLEVKLREILGPRLISFSRLSPRHVFVEVPREEFKKSIRQLVEKFDIKHISTITGIDLGENVELIYHLWCDKLQTLLCMRVKIPKESLKIESITDILPGAILYEREVFDMLGVEFEGHPDLRHLLLPEVWPEGVHPLRKDVTLEELRKIMLRRGVK